MGSVNENKFFNNQAVWEVFGLGEAQLFPTISDAIEAHLDQSDGSTE
jgi:hypothetical protein